VKIFLRKNFSTGEDLTLGTIIFFRAATNRKNILTHLMITRLDYFIIHAKSENIFEKI
jgi:hypothetical protein